MSVKWIILYALHLNPITELPPLPELPPIQETGLASWYGSGIDNDNGMHGTHTATGEVFDPSLATAASRSIPLNTIVYIEDASTGNIASCRVNDRGPYGALLEDGTWTTKFKKKDPGRWRGIMDLARGCAEQLEFDFNRGLNKIHVRYWK